MNQQQQKTWRKLDESDQGEYLSAIDRAYEAIAEARMLNSEFGTYDREKFHDITDLIEQLDPRESEEEY